MSVAGMNGVGYSGLVSSERLASECARLSGGKVLIVGDCMLDKYLQGDARRISPEAPVPVVLVEEERHLLGGAGNVARNIRSLGGGVLLIGLCGDDPAGRELQHCLDKDGIANDLVVLPGRPTTVKTRVLARQQQVVRIDRENSSPLRPADISLLLQKVKNAMPGCGAVVVSDYGKGIVCAPFMRGLMKILAEQSRHIPLLVDPKPQNSRLYKNATLLTPNAKECSESAGMPTDTPEHIIRAGRALMRRLSLKHLIVTLGGRGMAVFENAERACHIPTLARKVFDVTGAGDTVIATLALGLAAGLDLIPASLIANYAAGLVVAEVGAATVTLQELKENIAASTTPEIAEWK